MFNQNKIFRVLQLIGVLRSSPPKPIPVLAKMLNSTERTVYRYIDLLNDLGFKVDKNENRHIYISGPATHLLADFSQAEVQLIRRLLQSAGKSNKLKDSILHKISLHSGSLPLSKDILHARLGKIVEDLHLAMVERKQVVLKKYHSLNTNGVSDRLVEPTGFTDSYKSLSAFEVATGRNKYFNIERIMAVEIRKRGFRFSDKHKFSPADVFGFADEGIRREVELSMTLRAATLMKEEYPLTAAFIRHERKKGRYRLKVTVHDYKPVARFVFGLPEDIIVIGSEEFSDYLTSGLEILLGNSRRVGASQKMKRKLK